MKHSEFIELIGLEDDDISELYEHICFMAFEFVTPDVVRKNNTSSGTELLNLISVSAKCLIQTIYPNLPDDGNNDHTFDNVYQLYSEGFSDRLLIETFS